MLKWAIIFFIIALLAGWMGFGRVSSAAATIAKVLCTVFVILFLFALLVMIGVIKSI